MSKTRLFFRTLRLYAVAFVECLWYDRSDLAMLMKLWMRDMEWFA